MRRASSGSAPARPGVTTPASAADPSFVRSLKHSARPRLYGIVSTHALLKPVPTRRRPSGAPMTPPAGEPHSTVEVALGERSYQVIIGDGLLAALGANVRRVVGAGGRA